MRLLIADGGQRRDHHVKAIEPGPTFDEVKAGRTGDDDERESEANEAEIVEGLHGNSRRPVSVVRKTASRLSRIIVLRTRRSSAISQRPPAISRRPTTEGRRLKAFFSLPWSERVSL